MTRARLAPLALALLVAPAPLASAQTQRLNGPLARPVGGDVRQFQLNRLGDRVLYLADQERDEVVELYAVKPGAPPYKLSEPMPAAGDVFSFLLSPDGQRVVYRANPGGRAELFSVPIDGGPVLKLNPQLPANGDVLFFQIDPASQRAIFHVEAFSALRAELFSAPLDGSAPAVQLNRAEPLTLPARVAGQHATYASLTQGQGYAVFGVPIDGSREPVQLTPFLARAPSYELALDGTRVLYVDTGLFAIPIDGRGGPIDLSGTAPIGVVRVNEFRLSADGLRAAYRRSNGELYSVSTLGNEVPIPLGARPSGSLFEIDPSAKRVLFSDGDLRLHSVPLLGGTPPVALSGAGTVNRFEALADGRVVFVEDPAPPMGLPDQQELWIAPADGQAPALLLASAKTSFTGLDFIVGRRHVVYRALTGIERQELHSVPLDGSAAPGLLSDALVDEREVRVPFTTSGNGHQVAYLADRDQDELFELFHVPADASRAPVKVNPPLVLGRVEGDVVEARYSRDGARAVYRADAREDEVFELFDVPIGPMPVPVRLNGDLVPGGDVQAFALAPAHVVYLADQDVNDVAELYSVPLGGGLSVRLNGGVIDSIRFFELSPDGAHVVYQADEDGDGLVELRRVPADGSAVSAALSPGLSEFETSRLEFRVAPDSLRVVYAGDPERDGTLHLYSASLAGGAPVLLSTGLPLDFFLDGQCFQITSDGGRVLFRSGGALHAVPTDGSAAPLLLSPGLFVGSYVLTADGTRVAFTARPDLGSVLELHAAPVDGSAAPTPLGGLRATNLAITPDATRVVYLVPTSVPLQHELHSAPLDGSAAPVLVAPAARYETPSLTVPFRLSADSRRVAFRVDRANLVYELRSAPVDGSAPPLVISRPNAADASVRADYVLTPDGKSALYRVGIGPVDLGSELFHVPLHGNREPTRISLRRPALTETVYGFELSPDGQQVLHRTVQDTAGAIELYVARFAQAPRFERR